MKDSIILQGKTYISARRAAKIINYAQDYVGQLCRAGKLDCTMIGRSWFVTEESLLSHRENAVDGVADKVPKVSKDVEVVPVTMPAVTNTPVMVTPAPVVSPIQSFPKYEVERKALLPELNKKVPTTFSLPKTIVAAPASTLSISNSVNPVIVVTAVVLIATAGFLFTVSLTSVKNGNVATRSEASVGSAVGGFFTRMMQSLGIAPRVESPVAKVNKPEVEVADNFNGIGVAPSAGPAADALEKAKIKNSFSDEVTIEPDESGTSGVVKPVFKKTDGKDFVYVLVPVKEKKQ
jgi:hypothetical protein